MLSGSFNFTWISFQTQFEYSTKDGEESGVNLNAFSRLPAALIASLNHIVMGQKGANGRTVAPSAPWFIWSQNFCRKNAREGEIMRSIVHQKWSIPQIHDHRGSINENSWDLLMPIELDQTKRQTIEPDSRHFKAIHWKVGLEFILHKNFGQSERAIDNHARR